MAVNGVLWKEKADFGNKTVKGFIGSIGPHCLLAVILLGSLWSSGMRNGVNDCERVGRERLLWGNLCKISSLASLHCRASCGQLAGAAVTAAYC